MAEKTNNNLSIWDQVEKTDPAFTKRFSRGGGFSGTATNATYLARRATELFGPIGIGWGVEPVSEAYIEGAPIAEGVREVVHKVLVKLWYIRNGERGEVVQFGQTTFVGKNKYGPFTDEEHAKKSLTDGMSKCLSLLGFAADIHLGRYDDHKYVAAVTAEYQEADGAKPITEDSDAEGHAFKVLPCYPAKQFDKNLPAWLGAIKSGKKSASDIIAMVETKGRLTDEQKTQIRGEKIEAEAA